MRMYDSERLTFDEFGGEGKILSFFGHNCLVFDMKSNADRRIYNRVISNVRNFSVVKLPECMGLNVLCKNCGCSLRPYMPKMIGRALTRCPLCEKEVTELNE